MTKTELAELLKRNTEALERIAAANEKQTKLLQDIDWKLWQIFQSYFDYSDDSEHESQVLARQSIVEGYINGFIDPIRLLELRMKHESERYEKEKLTK